jgi:hypothetical protein
VPVPTGTVVPVSTGKLVPVPTDTVVPVPTGTLVPVPTDTVVPVHTGTEVPVPTDTVVPVTTGTLMPVATEYEPGWIHSPSLDLLKDSVIAFLYQNCNTPPPNPAVAPFFCRTSVLSTYHQHPIKTTLLACQLHSQYITFPYTAL